MREVLIKTRVRFDKTRVSLDKHMSFDGFGHNVDGDSFDLEV